MRTFRGMELGMCLHIPPAYRPGLTTISSQFFQTPHCERVHAFLRCTAVLTRCSGCPGYRMHTYAPWTWSIHDRLQRVRLSHLSAFILLSSACSGSQSIYQHRQRPSEFEFATPLQVNVRRTVRIDVESEYSPCESISRPTSDSYTSHHSSKPSQPDPPSTSH